MIGIYGGTFDPPHLGHIHVAEALLKKYSLKKLYWVPTGQNPLKKLSETSAEDRLQLSRAALQELGNEKIILWDHELKKSGKSYTIDTLKEIQSLEKEETLLALGNEAFQELREWKNPKEILELVNLAVIVRTSEKVLDPTQILHGLNIFDYREISKNHWTHSRNFRWIEFLEINALPFSSTDLRKNLRDSWNTNELALPLQGIQRSVCLLIKELKLYRR